MRCIFNPPTNATCNGCRRRGSKCVSQEFPEDLSLSKEKTHNMASSDGTTSNGRTPTTPMEEGRRTGYAILTPVSINSEPSQFLSFYKYSKDILPGGSELYKLQSATDAPTSQGKYERLSRFLQEFLPSREDMENIFRASGHPSVLSHEILTVPYTVLEQNGLKIPESLLDTPDPSLHPVLISRHMLQLAIFLQNLHPDLHEEVKGLSESPRAIMERLADLAISLVTTNDELLGSIEGLECIMMESMYQVNVGNLRRGWVVNRRAMGIAQLMGLDRLDNRAQYKVLDPKKEYHPQLMWFRILFLDRHLCLMLGLPQGSLDSSVASDAMLAEDTSIGRLERIHCVLASRIIERNKSTPSSHEFDLTRTLDVELQRAARSLPSKWWLSPNLDVASTDSQVLYWETLRLFVQVTHYNLLNQLHLPYMLRSSSVDRKYEYSRITCVNASREVLSRFIILRTFNRIAYSCRIIDFLALMAAMTLLLAHLESHRSSEAENLLAHQYLSDRAMIEQAQENMREINRLNSDALSAQSADLLSRLLAIEAETADGYSRCGGRVSVQEAGTETALPDQDEDAIVSVHVPYFGIIKIAREGVSKEVPKQQATTTTNYLARLQVANNSSTNKIDTLHAETQVPPSELAGPSRMSDGQLGKLPIPSTGDYDVATHVSPQLQYGLSDPLLQNGEYPGLAAGGDDWAFQGVDMAFFDSLMRSGGDEGNEDAEWTAWQR
ncbi:hypothetical protein K505DRAFT_289023 [Melanomma pulvis-pyrius CBS 109.77]|uniref:Xylanolytic transcriptional activator regulatory domain-containing protein n=1 Tax=Melanomma pulvis-pyrius CBS 109.77 TaxID=1314802 RepID=A0A6A6WRT1_9PLEO|nr:hypothetical protein K505DRAFT_289023 [Melanomma pulvis-pyrius CBS 109.77]